MMNAKSGQVALYLILAIAAIVVLAVMNVGVFCGIRAKNTAMNAGDAAALAVAKHQGELLNRIGELNLVHLKAMVEKSLAPNLSAPDRAARVASARLQGERCYDEQRRLCFLGPLDGITIGNEAAKRNGAIENREMKDILQRHVDEIKAYYVDNPEAYPEPWEGAWVEYAAKLSNVLAEGIWAGPDNIDFVDAQTGHYLLMKQFYNAVAGQNWCWFHFNAGGLLSSYLDFHSWPPLPFNNDGDLRRRRCENSEVYSLGLTVRIGSAIAVFGTDAIRRLAGASADDIAESTMLLDSAQHWYFYDTLPSNSSWLKWSDSEICSFNSAQFPIVGNVKREYDVLGCAAICRVEIEFANLLGMGENRVAEWSAAAKPFGTVEDERGDRAVVTAIGGGLVTPAFTDVRLVPVDSVGGADLATADPDWMRHVRDHLPEYVLSGPNSSADCYYCRQLSVWERDSVRTNAVHWLNYNSASCIRETSGGSSGGGSAHGH